MLRSLLLGISAVGALIGSHFVFGETTPGDIRQVDISADAWLADGATVEFGHHLGRPAMRISDGEIVIRSAALASGVIEFDVAITDARGFVGLNFHRSDSENHESIYIRNHQSGNPDANQYTPVFNGVVGWQIYYGPQYSTPVKYRYNEWMRVKVAFSEDEAELYIDGEAVLHIDDLKADPADFGLALWTNINPAWISNVRLQSGVPTFELEAVAEPKLSSGVIRAWQVSDPILWGDIESTELLPQDVINNRTWQYLAVETNGVANIARIAQPSHGDTVLVKVSAPADQARQLKFGFTNRARVYVDRELVYEGTDAYGSRDYRFLGTVGLYDSVFVSSNNDEVEFIIAVREGFGGWGVIGELPHSEPIIKSVESITGNHATTIDAILSEMSRSGYGGAVIYSEHGEILLEAGYGFADREGRVPFTSSVLAPIGSLSKQFTAMAVIELAARELIGFADTVGEYVGDRSQPGATVTIDQLLTHTSGMAQYCGRDYESYSRDEMVDMCLSTPLLFRPGERYAYSNVGFSILAAIVEIVSKTEFEEFLRHEVLEPNGLFKTGYVPPHGAVGAKGYLDEVDQGIFGDRLSPLDGQFWALKGNGGMQSTTKDMFRWYQALAGQQELKPGQIREATIPRFHYAIGKSIAYGWRMGVSDDGTVNRISHAGSDGVFCSYFWWNPVADQFFYIVGNNGESNVGETILAILGQMNETEEQRANGFATRTEDVPACAIA